MREKLRRAWAWFRYNRGYCALCMNYRRGDSDLCAAHTRLRELREL